MKAVAGVLIFTKDCMPTSANLAANVVLAVACVAIDRWKDESCMSATDSDSLSVMFEANQYPPINFFATAL